MESKKKWWQSKTIGAAITLILVSGFKLLEQINFITSEAAQAAQVAYPQIESGIEQVKGQMWYSGIATLIGALVVYFRSTAKAAIG